MYMHTVLCETERHMKAQLELLESMAANATKDPIALKSINTEIAWLKSVEQSSVVNPEQSRLNAKHLDQIRARLKSRPTAKASTSQRYPNRLMGLPL
jgi:uncharacterized coiled-coil DUF342 family protein